MSKDQHDTHDDVHARRRAKFVTAELLRLRIATYSVIGLSAAAGLLFVVLAYSAFPNPPAWEGIAILVIAVVCAAVPLMGKFSVSKDGSGVDFVKPIDLYQQMEEYEKKAAAARAESFEQTRQQIGALSQQVAEILDEAAATPATKGAQFKPRRRDDEPTLRDIRQSLPVPTIKNDPQKTRFGGSRSITGRALTATTYPSGMGKKWRRVLLTLTSTDGSPLSGNAVFFFLHDSFDPDEYRVAIKPGSKVVEFKTTAIGAFTAGVVADQGATKLEIDLADDDIDAPPDWKAR